MQSFGILCVGRLPREEVRQWGWEERAYGACWMEGSVENSKGVGGTLAPGEKAKR